MIVAVAFAALRTTASHPRSATGPLCGVDGLVATFQEQPLLSNLPRSAVACSGPP